jgi:hypothetical protein
MEEPLKSCECINVLPAETIEASRKVFTFIASVLAEVMAEVTAVSESLPLGGIRAVGC